MKRFLLLALLLPFAARAQLLPVTTQQTGGTLSATAGVFVPVVPPPAQGTFRRGCQFFNTSTATEYVFFGQIGNATSTNSIPVQPGGSLGCLTGVNIAQDAVSAASTLASATYVVTAQ